MYSINGRKKDEKKVKASTEREVSKLICDECHYIEAGRFKEFGEVFVCSNCGSENVHFEK